jgi:hypothetical protein
MKLKGLGAYFKGLWKTRNTSTIIVIVPAFNLFGTALLTLQQLDHVETSIVEV